MSDTLEHSIVPEIETPAKPPAEPTYWVTDAELIRRSGVPEKIAYATLRRLDAAPGLGFPEKVAMWGNRRYWPAVKAYWQDKYGVKFGSTNRGSR